MEKKLIEQFKDKFDGAEPLFVARAPGRVNLIGEHIDYSGYGVLPMALTQSIFAAASVNDTGEIRLLNTNEQFLPHQCSFDDYTIDSKAPKWFHYFLCGYKGMTEFLRDVKKVNLEEKHIGINVLLSGEIPPSAGLSSSSALVCCSAIVTMKAFGFDFDTVSRTEVADVAIKCEKHIGTEGGGMDQAISMLAEAGKAKYVTFNPLLTVPVKLPAKGAFVVSHSCVEMNKAASMFYNTRVVECRIAAQILALKNELDWKSIRTLGQLQMELDSTPEDLIFQVALHLRIEPYSRQEVLEILEIDDAEFCKISLNSNTQDMKSFQITMRAMHVYEEANRVLKFKQLCDDAELNPIRSENLLEQLGTLMNESHESCQRQYECSCDELDELVAICRNAGALGSRLTGAGWGGCTVSLVAEEKAEEFLLALKQGFYDKTPRRKEMFSTAVFITHPASGAEIIPVGEQKKH